MIKGVYTITNTLNNNTYVGISNNIEMRWNKHKQDLLNNTHHNYNLQKEFNKVILEYKENVFNIYEFIIIKVLTNENINEMRLLEDEYILKIRYKDINNYGYKQKTNYELYRDGYKQSIFNNLYVEKHKEINKKYINIEKQKHIDETNNFTLKLNYNNELIEVEWLNNSCNNKVAYWSYFYNNNKNINKTIFKDITINKILEYVYYHIYNAEGIKKTLQSLKKNHLITCNIPISKLKVDTIFTVELINISNIINYMIKDLKENNCTYNYIKY